MAMNYDPYGDPSQLYQQAPWTQPYAGQFGQPAGQAQPIDQWQVMQPIGGNDGAPDRTTFDWSKFGQGSPDFNPGGISGKWQYRNDWTQGQPYATGRMDAPTDGSNTYTWPDGHTTPYIPFNNPWQMQGQQPQAQSSQPNWQGQSVTPDQINGYFASRGVNPNSTSAGYWASKWPELYQRGLQIGNPNYAYQRLQYADEFLPGGPETSPFYEGPQGGGQQQMGGGNQIASVTPSSTASSVAPTWAAMLGNTSAYKKQSDPTGPGMGRISDPAGPTIAQLLGMGR